MLQRETDRVPAVSLISYYSSFPAHALKNPIKLLREALPFVQLPFRAGRILDLTLMINSIICGELQSTNYRDFFQLKKTPQAVRHKVTHRKYEEHIWQVPLNF
jgi:hypothetical protein